MNTTGAAELKEKVLEFINKCREVTGLEPLTKIPKGNRCTGYSCPVAKGVNWGIYAGGSGLTTGGPTEGAFEKLVKAFDARTPYEVPYPDPVEEFVRRFDDGEFPELAL